VSLIKENTLIFYDKIFVERKASATCPFTTSSLW